MFDWLAGTCAVSDQSQHEILQSRDPNGGDGVRDEKEITLGGETWTLHHRP